MRRILSRPSSQLTYTECNVIAYANDPGDCRFIIDYGMFTIQNDFSGCRYAEADHYYCNGFFVLLLAEETAATLLPIEKSKEIKSNGFCSHVPRDVLKGVYSTFTNNWIPSSWRVEMCRVFRCFSLTAPWPTVRACSSSAKMRGSSSVRRPKWC